MNRTRLTFVVGAALLALLLAALPAGAQTPAVTASVDRDQITTDETLLLTVAISGAADQPNLPQLDGFRILSAGSSTQMSVVNGASSVLTSYQYLLQPLHAGDLVIPPISAQVDGRQETTEPIRVTVTQGTGQAPAQPASPGNLPNLFSGNVDPWDLLNQLDQWMQSSGSAGLGGAAIPATPGEVETIAPPEGLNGQDYYLEAVVDNAAPYQGQQIAYKMRLYRAVSPLGQITYQAPAFSGFWSKELPDQVNYRTEAGGRPYAVTELQTLLFPTVAGEVAIEPGRMQIPGDFFSNGVEIASQPLTLNVAPLPANAPASFTGAVGDFDIAAEVDSSAANVGDAVTQRVTITGRGNLDTMDDPIWPEMAGWRVFDSQVKTETQVRDGQLVGVRGYERVLMPTEGGDLTLPPVEFSFFDPGAGEYRTVATDPATVAVAAAAAADAAPVAAAAAAVAPATPASVPSLRPLKPGPESWAAAREPVTQQPLYWLLWSVPVALVLGQRGWQSYRNGRLASGEKAKRQARKQAERALRDAPQDGPAGAAAAARILHGYLETVLGQPTAGLTRQQLAGLLTAHGAPASLAAQVQDVLQTCETHSFAPASTAGAGADDLPTQVAALIAALDQAL